MLNNNESQKIKGFDIIGDIHGHCSELLLLLEAMGYQHSKNGYRHPDRRAIFVGDYIDRGTQQLKTLEIVRQMVENNNAYAILGNHEFNALGWFF